jgi:predicted phage terminase large subunit-like protein
VLRGRFLYPILKARVIAHAKLHNPGTILIEDAGTGTALVQDPEMAPYSVVPVKPEYDKKIRMSIQSAKFESGRVFFPNQAHWLADLELELFAFPRGRHDDQVDSISQALGYKLASGWTAESLDGYANFVNALCADAVFGRLAGRPW